MLNKKTEIINTLQSQYNQQQSVLTQVSLPAHIMTIFHYKMLLQKHEKIIGGTFSDDNLVGACDVSILACVDDTLGRLED